MISTIDLLKAKGCQHIKVLVLVAAPEGIKALEKAHPDIELYCASIDDHLNEQGYIIQAWVMQAIRFLGRNNSLLIRRHLWPSFFRA